MSSYLIVWRARWRSSWTQWSLQRTLAKEIKAHHRLRLLLAETDHQHLRIKDLQQKQQQLHHRQEETRESEQYRLQGIRPGLMQVPLTPSGEKSQPL